MNLYQCFGIHWDFIDDSFDPYFEPKPKPLCPKQKCYCVLTKSNEEYSLGEYKYCCPRCDFKITFDKSIEEKGRDFLNILSAGMYKDAEIINLDGDLVRIQREEESDNDYWIDAKISKNKKGEVQLMVLAGSKKEKNKCQLFFDVSNQKMTFDQNNDHPKKIFTKVVATFKETKTEIRDK